MRISVKTLAAIGVAASTVAGIATWEAYRGTAYDDGVGVQTYGWGTTQGVRKGDTTTPTRALIRLVSDADAYAKGLAACLGDVPLAPHEWEAYVSWTYNVGVRAACTSKLVKKLKQTPPDYEGACKELLRWNSAKGEVLRGLTLRREAEYRRCMGETETIARY